MAKNLATHRRVVAATERETRVCERVGFLLAEIFPPVGRSGQGDSKGGVAGKKKCRLKSPENFSDSQGDMTTAEDSRDEDGVVGVRYNH